MWITNNDYEKISKAMELLPHGDTFDSLTEEEKQIIVDVDVIMVNLFKKKKADNERVAKYVAKKRKEDKNYARSKGGKS